MKHSLTAARAILAACALACLFAFGCNLNGEGDAEQTFTFPTLADSLRGSDSAIIVLKDARGNLLDTLYKGPVAKDSFVNLRAPHYNGGKAVIEVEGLKDGETVFQMVKQYSGRSGFTDSTIVLVSRPVATGRVDSVVVTPDALDLALGGPTGTLRAKVHPESLSQAISWSSLEMEVATVSPLGEVSAVDSGIARIVATSSADKSKADTVQVRVRPSAKPEQISFGRTQLDLYVDGASETITITVLPEDAIASATFFLEDSTLVRLKDGKLYGLRAGETRLTARSAVDTSVSAILRIMVHPKPAEPVDSVTLNLDTLRIFTGGERQRLLATIHPTSHAPRLIWRSAAPAIASVDTLGWVSPAAAGRVFVSARSAADSTKADSALVIVKRDVPRIDVGGDTVVSTGSTVSFNPQVSQEYGLTTLVRWDLDGNLAWDDSAVSFNPLQRQYSAAGEILARFYARDSEGNDTTVTKRIKVSSGPIILFHAPANGTYTNQAAIAVTWSVNGIQQTSQEALKAGPNTITRSAKDEAGETYSASIIVHLDTDPPGRPVVKGPSGPMNSLRPAWSWETAGGGNGTFRYRLNSDNLAVGATEGQETDYTPSENLVGGTHTLYVQERDAAGNWSQTGSYTVRIDTTPPPAPTVQALTSSPTNDRRPTWTWSGSSTEATSAYRYKLDNNDLRVGATATGTASFTPTDSLSEGPHTLYVQHADSAGNWSVSGSLTIRIDLTPPISPTVTGPASPTNVRRPTWTIAPRGGGNGTFRYKFGDRNLTLGATETVLMSIVPGQDLAAGLHTLHVQEKDSAGNWSASDSASVLIDLSTPGAPTVNLQTPSPTNNQTPTWTWRMTGTGTGDFRFKFNDANLSTGATETRDTLYTHGIPLPAGTYSLYVQQRNQAGTWSASGSRTVRIDTTKPAPPTVTLDQSSPTNERRPTWRWTKDEPGTGFFRFSLDNAAFRDTNSTSFQPSQILTEGNHLLRIQIRDSAGNWSEIASTGISIDITPPNPPTFESLPRSPLNSNRPTWQWQSGGNSGNGMFRYKLNDGNLSAGATTIQSNTFQPPESNPLNEGRHVLYIQERDTAGNWSGTSSKTIVVSTRGHLGTAGQGQTNVSGVSLSLIGDVPYSAVGLNNKISVFSFVNGNWQTQGTGLYSGNSWYFNINGDNEGIPHIAFSESDNDQKLSVMRLSGGSWTYVGNPRFTSGTGTNPRMHFSPTNIPYVLYDDGSEGGAINVARYRGFWEELRQDGLPAGQAADYAMAFMKDGTPLIAFVTHTDYGVTVAKYSFTSNTWTTIGSFIGEKKFSDAIDLVVNANDEPIVAFQDQGLGRITVRRLSGNQWIDYGGTGLPGAEWGEVGLALGADQSPIIAFVNSNEVGRLSIMTISNSTWQPIGPVTLSSAAAAMITLRANSLGVPFAAYQDGGSNWGISVLKTSYDP